MKALKIHYIVLSISILFAIATALGFWQFSVVMNNRQDRVKDVKEKLAVYKGNKEVFEQETKQMKLLLEKTTKLEQAIVTTSTLPTFLSTIENLAKEKNITFNIISAQNSGKVGVEKLVIDFSAKGDFKSINDFLNTLSHQSYQVNFNKFVLFAEVDTVQVPGTTTVKVVPKAGPVIWGLTASIDVVSFSI